MKLKTRIVIGSIEIAGFEFIKSDFVRIDEEDIQFVKFFCSDIPVSKITEILKEVLDSEFIKLENMWYEFDDDYRIEITCDLTKFKETIESKIENKEEEIEL